MLQACHHKTHRDGPARIRAVWRQVLLSGKHFHLPSARAVNVTTEEHFPLTPESAERTDEESC
jgi:hypothetical protein